MPKVSVIIPVYNTEKYLRRCLDSVCNQTLSDIEIICINDCSTDSSLDILREYSTKDDRIKVINFKENKGAAVARNTGIDEAQGEYLGFVDSDDFIDLDFYEKLYTKAIETNADAVKGCFMEINDNSLIPKLIPNYNLNDLIPENNAYFYFTFTSAIYNTNFIKKNNINFPENLCHMEDNYFTIKAGLYYQNLQLVNNTSYYYVLTKTNRENKKSIKTIYEDAFKAAEIIISMINNTSIEKEHYMIVYSFIIKQIMEFLRINTDDNNSDFLENALNKLCSICKYPAEINTYLIKTSKKIDLAYNNHKDTVLKLLQTSPYNILNKYKNYSKYISDINVKILVSYIEPSFLFKSDILTPIHLGRAVEKENSKDGIQSDNNLEWLHKNCEFHDDFEGGISECNRRIGFLTGTYWAWKNYEKLGNPNYFGFCAHRKILDPNILLHIKDVDLILPEQFNATPNIEQQYALRHSMTRWNIILDTIKKIHPEDYIPFVKFSHQTFVNFYEIYVMKKNLFFDYCEWIFPILFELLSLPEEQFAFTQRDKEKILNFYKYEDSYSDICNERTFDSYQQRDIGYMIERLTGYYMYKLKQDTNIKYLEANVIFIEDFSNKINLLRKNRVK